MLYSRKLTEHCKPAIMEKKIIIYIHAHIYIHTHTHIKQNQLPLCIPTKNNWKLKFCKKIAFTIALKPETFRYKFNKIYSGFQSIPHNLYKNLLIKDLNI